MKKILNLKLVILLEYQNKKTFLQKTMFQIDLKIFLSLKRKTLCRGHILLVILKEKKQFERSEKVTKGKGDKLYFIWEGYDSSFNSWIDKKDKI